MKKISALQTFVVTLLSTAHLLGQTPGTLDTTFQAQMPTDFVYQFFRPLAVRPDGKILVGGKCNMAESGSRFLARLRSDGALDSGFNPVGLRCFGGGECDFFNGMRGGRTGSFFSDILVQADGKIVLGGREWEVPELCQAGLARLNGDGSADPSFEAPRDPNFTSPRQGWSWDIRKLVMLPSGGYLIATCCGGGAPEFNLLRLKPSGELDSSFAPQLQGAYPNVYAFAVQPDDRIVVSLPATLIEGKKRNVIRLLPDGSYDSNFERILTDGDVQVVEILPDGNILLGSGVGGFRSVNGRARPGLARLHADGRLDLDFVPFTDDLDTRNMAIQRDGKIILPQFWNVNGLPTRQLVRLKTDGRRDETYVSELRHAVHLREGVDSFGVVALALQPDEKLLVSTIDASEDGGWIGSIIRLHGDGLPYITPTSIGRTGDAGIRFQITAATNRIVIVEVSADLNFSRAWSVAGFPPAIDRAAIQFTNSDLANIQGRFYRAISP